MCDETRYFNNCWIDFEYHKIRCEIDNSIHDVQYPESVQFKKRLRNDNCRYRIARDRNQIVSVELRIFRTDRCDRYIFEFVVNQLQKHVEGDK